MHWGEAGWVKGVLGGADAGEQDGTGQVNAFAV